MLILIERLAKFLRDHQNGAFCNGCLLELLDAASMDRMVRFTTALGSTSEFRLKPSGRCSFCGTDQTTIQATPTSAAHPFALLSGQYEVRGGFSDLDIGAGPEHSASA